MARPVLKSKTKESADNMAAISALCFDNMLLYKTRFVLQYVNKSEFINHSTSSGLFYAANEVCAAVVEMRIIHPAIYCYLHF